MSNYTIDNTYRITPNDVRSALVNLPQLVFEVTDGCNLSCKYCAFGDMYWGYDRRESKKMSFSDAKTVIDYLVALWREFPSLAQRQPTTIGFYGGEPLLNFQLIRQVVSYVEDMGLSRCFDYTMTSNCLLLDRHMDFIAEKGFRLLCSLDGDKAADGYRVRHDGEASFETVFRNIKSLKAKYPTYFREKVDFNTVLHNLNSVQGVCDFMKREFDKYPSFSPLSDVGVRPEKKEEFTKAFKSISESFHQAENHDEIAEAMGVKNPDSSQLLLFLDSYLPGVFSGYSELFSDATCRKCIPSGTCLPFTKKLFMKVDGKILQCERIPHMFSLGYVKNGVVHLDFSEIAEKFNSLLDKLQDQCGCCSLKGRCGECLYQMDGMEGGRPKCSSFLTEKQHKQYELYYLEYLYSHPGLYKKYIDDVILEI